MSIYEGSSQDLILSSLRDDTGHPLTEQNVSIAPVKTTGAKYITKIKGKQLSGYASSKKVQIPRIDISILFKGFEPLITMPDATNTKDAIANINYRYGLNLTQEDIVNRSRINYADGRKYFDLEISDKSLQYTGIKRFKYVPEKPLLGFFLGINDLGSLKWNVEDPSKVSLGLCLYETDFSKEYEFLIKLTDGKVTNSITLEQIKDILNEKLDIPIEDLSGINIKKDLTTNVFHSCKSFINVIEITNFKRDPYYTGPIWMHFNI